MEYYFLPRSGQWWVSVVAIAVGLSAMFWPDYGPLAEMSRAISGFMGGVDVSPGGLVLAGALGITNRAKMEALGRAAIVTQKAVIAKVEATKDTIVTEVKEKV